MIGAEVHTTAELDVVCGGARADDAPVVLLASTCAWPSVPKLAIALARADCVVVAVAPAHHPLNITAAVSRRLRYSAARPLRSLRAAIAKLRPDLIIACDERVVEHLHRLHAETADDAVRALIERSLGRPDGYGRTTSREALAALAAKLGVLAPAAAPLASIADLRVWARTQPLPWVIKVDGSWGGVGVRVVASVAEAERAFHDLSRPIRPIYALRRLLFARDPFWLAPWLHRSSRRITLQRYIEGRPANCVVAVWNGERLAGVAVEVVACDGETGPASIVRPVDDPRMLTDGASLARALGLSGLIGFDFIIETATGRPFLLEMNPRATPIAHLRLGAGRDPVGAVIARLRGVPTPDQPAETMRQTIALFPQAQLQFPESPVLADAYQDTPVHDPRLVGVLMRRRQRQRARPTPDFAPGAVEPV